MSWKNRRALSLLFVLFLLLLLATNASLPGATSRVVAIGDIHGDFDAFIGILQRARLIDTDQKWAGGSATLVQTGDFLDRGQKARAVMDFLMALQKDAPRQKGRVVVLMGNHEAMNIYSDLRYVADADYASFGGRAERCKAFDAEGRYGKWLRTLPAVAQLNNSIFLHGGISPELASWTVEKINDTIAAEIQSYDRFKKFAAERKIASPCATLDDLANSARGEIETAKGKDAELLMTFLTFPQWLSIHPNGPLWFRGYAEWTDREGAPQIGRLIEAFGVDRFVVGHTVQAGQVGQRFDRKVYLIDTGMLSSFFKGGRASALNIEDGKVTAIY